MTTSLQSGAVPLSCPPRFGTPRNPARETLGGQVADVADQLGTPLMPWQRHVMDIAMEIDPETGLLWYGEIVCTVPRQSGKTTAWLSLSTHRALAWPTPQNIVYTAQTRGAARKKWADEHIPALTKSVFADLMGRPRYANDSEHLPWNNGSRYGIEAGTETAGHGSVYDLGGIDEAFAPESERREQAIRPAMVTRPEPQLWVISTAGTATSLYLKEKVDRGRARIESGKESRVAYFEWSAPEDADIDDENVWRQCMPALGHTITINAIRTVRESMSEAGFRRAYLNQWVTALKADQIITPDDWAAALDAESRVATDMPRVLAIDISPFQDSGSISVGGLRPDGLRHVQVVQNDADADWIVPRVREMIEQRTIARPIILCGAMAAALADEFAEHDIETHVLTLSEQRAASAGLKLDVPLLLRHIGQVELDTALANATKRGSSDGWVFDRRGTVDITPVVSIAGVNWAIAQGYADQRDVLSTIY